MKQFEITHGELRFLKIENIISAGLDRLAQEVVDCSEEEPYIIANIYIEYEEYDEDNEVEGEVDYSVLEIREPFIRYYDDSYEATSYIEFSDGSVYIFHWETPAEAQTIEHIEEYLEASTHPYVEGIKKLVHELEQIPAHEIIV
jgi:hypothetical protein